MMKRRDFVKNIALGGAGLTLGRSAWAEFSAVRSPNERIQVALIGARNMGGRTHLPSLVGANECQLTAICDVDQNVLAEAVQKAETKYAEKEERPRFRGVRGYGDFREVMANDEIDAVLIATPDHWHVPLAKAAILAGKDVYVEKPLSLYIEEGRDLSDLVSQSGAILQVGSQHRTDSRFQLAAALVQAGALGKVKHVEVAIRTRSGKAEPWSPQPVPPELDYDMWVGPVTMNDFHPERTHYSFRFVPPFSGGEIANWGAHFIDSAQQCLGTDVTGPVKAQGTGKRNPVGSLHTSYYDLDVDFEYATGVTMKLITGENYLNVAGENGSLRVSRGSIATDPESLLRSVPRDELALALKTKGSHLQNWLHCVRTRNPGDLHAPVEIGHRSATMCHLANIAIELGRPLQWDPDREIFMHDAHANALRNRPVRDKWKI